MAELTLTELAAFLSTPEAQALATQAEKIEAAQDWKAALIAANEPVTPTVDPADHLANLKAERAEWGQAWRKWPTDEQKAIRLARIAELDGQINEVSKLITA